MSIIAIILAGGKSSRMGQDKGLMRYHGKSMILHIIEAVKESVDAIYISTSNADYKKFGYKLISDDNPDKGPLGGIVSVMDKIKADEYIILSCDVPHIERDYLNELVLAAKDYDVTLTIKDDRIHPLIAVYNQSALNHLKEQLALDNLKMTTAIEGLKINYHLAKKWPVQLVKNINTKKDIS
ncbi:MAG: molybdenum cofactor guanylyltransferase [Crocinitomicaceae bacterium]